MIALSIVLAGRSFSTSTIAVATATWSSSVNNCLKLMDTTWEQRQHQLMNNISDSLSDMALDQRLMPGVASQLQSSASTPSLRSREGSVTPIGGKIDAPGGNVRVVVRVRGFLPRGMIQLSLVMF